MEKPISYPSNKYGRSDLLKRLEAETFKRKTISFYKYVILENPYELRNRLFRMWSNLNCLGRIYIAREGINAQMNVPEHHWEQFESELFQIEAFANIPFKYAVEDDGKSFLKLTVKVRNKIVADGLREEDYDVTNVGQHLTADQWNDAILSGKATVVDMRNFYESEVGHFEGALLPQADTFRDELPEVLQMLEEKKNEKILLYCTGGIRCEKTSAFLKHHGFKDVNQLHGGIIDYVRQIKEKKLPNLFKGKNFVFDDRLGERISNDIISRCHQCQEPSDRHTNCANVKCNLLFIQCESCSQKHKGCCSESCENGEPIKTKAGKRHIFHRSPACSD